LKRGREIRVEWKGQRQFVPASSGYKTQDVPLGRSHIHQQMAPNLVCREQCRGHRGRTAPTSIQRPLVPLLTTRPSTKNSYTCFGNATERPWIPSSKHFPAHNIQRDARARTCLGLHENWPLLLPGFDQKQGTRGRNSGAYTSVEFTRYDMASSFYCRGPELRAKILVSILYGRVVIMCTV
jgi:hypothetical protein